MGLTCIVAYPIAAILDKILGDEVGANMTKGMMKKTFFNLERQKIIDPSERKFLIAALEL